VTAEEIMALRLMMEKLIMHAGDCERQLALERGRIEHLECLVMQWAVRAGKAEARVDTAAEAERAQIVAWMRRERNDLPSHRHISKEIEQGKHIKVKP
jgi:hypothetical protein